LKVLLATNNEPLRALIKRSLNRFAYDWIDVTNGFDAFQRLMAADTDFIIAEFDLPRMNSLEVLRRLRSLENFIVPPVLIVTTAEEERIQIEKERFQHTEIIARPLAIREFVAKVQQMLHQELRVTCLGGGTGLFTLLSGLKTLTGVSLSSIVNMSDDGGSTGKLRDMFGILPPGDIRRSLVALSTAPDLLNELIQYRFQRGGELKGHNLGNLLLTALAEMRGSMSQAVKSIGEILNIQGQVIPVTETQNVLKAQLENGETIEGEHRIDLFEGMDPKQRIQKVWQEPVATANVEALEAIYNSKYILMGPGDLFTSIVSNLVVEGIAEAICMSSAKKIYICNVMTKQGETTDFQVSDHIEQIVKYLGQDALDYVVCCSSEYGEEELSKYAKQHQKPVIERNKDRLSQVTKASIMWADVVSAHELVRHDSLKLAAEIKRIMELDQGQVG